MDARNVPVEFSVKQNDRVAFNRNLHLIEGKTSNVKLYVVSLNSINDS